MASVSSAAESKTGNNQFLRIVATISTLSGWLSAGMIMLAVLITCQMIFIRFVLNGSTVWQTEMVVYLMIAATLIGLPYVQRMRGHVNVYLIPIMCPPRLRYYLSLFTLSLSSAIVVVMLYYGYDYWHIAWARGWTSDTIWAVRLWIPYSALPIGFSLLLLQLIADLVAIILKIDAPFGLEDK